MTGGQTYLQLVADHSKNYERQTDKSWVDKTGKVCEVTWKSLAYKGNEWNRKITVYCEVWQKSNSEIKLTKKQKNKC